LEFYVVLLTEKFHLTFDRLVTLGYVPLNSFIQIVAVYLILLHKLDHEIGKMSKEAMHMQNILTRMAQFLKYDVAKMHN